MSYIKQILRSDEKLLATGYIHWIVYWPAIALMALAVISLIVLGSPSIAARIIFVLLALAAVFFAIKEWFQQWITEIAVTDRRVIVKTGLIRRHTAEMNMDKVVNKSAGLFGETFCFFTALTLRASKARRRAAAPATANAFYFAPMTIAQ